MSKKCLIVIDYQNDFVADDGALSCGVAAQKIEDSLIALVKSYQEEGGVVYFTKDWHPITYLSNHLESYRFPQHCIKKSYGSEIYGRLKEFCNEDNTIYKNSFTIAEDWLDDLILYDKFKSIELAGVATDICVLQNAVVLYNYAATIGRDIRFIVQKENCASFNEENHNNMINYMHNILGFEG